MYIIVALYFAFILTGCQGNSMTYTCQDSVPIVSDTTDVSTEMIQDSIGSTEVVEGDVYVYVCGQVAKPGVYHLYTGQRICDAIDMAGGCLETADINVVNQAEYLVDGSKIYIPAQGEENLALYQGAVDNTGLLNVNRATKDELMNLPGIGEVRAKAILEYREAQGGFRSVEDIKNIPGIKEGVFEDIREYITVE